MNIEKCWYKGICKNECSSSCVRFVVMNNLCEGAHLPMKLRFPPDLYPDNVDYDSFIFLQDWKENVVDHTENGDNLYIYSTHCGNGKTSWSAKIIMKYFDKIWHYAGLNCMALYISIPEFLIKSKSHFKQDTLEFEEFLELAKTVPLVVWDDITDFDSLTEYEKTTMLALLDTRFNNNLSNIFTGNILKDNMRGDVSQRIYSRLWNYCDTVEFKGNDRRGDKDY